MQKKIIYSVSKSIWSILWFTIIPCPLYVNALTSIIYVSTNDPSFILLVCSFLWSQGTSTYWIYPIYIYLFLSSPLGCNLDSEWLSKSIENIFYYAVPRPSTNQSLPVIYFFFSFSPLTAAQCSFYATSGLDFRRQKVIYLEKQTFIRQTKDYTMITDNNRT